MKAARRYGCLSHYKKCGNLKTAALAAAILCFIPALAHAQTAPEFASAQSFDIPAQQLATALREIAQQSGQELLFSPEVAAEKVTVGLKSIPPPLAAPSTLIHTTGTSFTQTSNKTTPLR